MTRPQPRRAYRKARGSDRVSVDLLHPRTAADVADLLHDASAAHKKVLIVGGRTHMDRGNPTYPDAELWTTQLDDLVAYEPAEMIVVVHAGMRFGQLASLLAEHGQEWPVDAAPEATVGGVIAAGVSSFRRLRVGHVRDTVLQMTIVTGDGRTVSSGARTVKNVSGFDVHRLVTGSLGTLGAIVEVALKVRPLPEARAVFRTSTATPFEEAARVVTAARGAAAVVMSPESVVVHLEGWAAEVEDLRSALRATATQAEEVAERDVDRVPALDADAVVAEVAVAPSRLREVVERHDRWQALAGVGIGWVSVHTPQELSALRERVAEAGGIAPVVRGEGGLGETAVPALEVHRRLKAAFDPRGILAPGRFWDGL